MVTPEVTEAWEFYRDNCPGFKEPMRKQFRKVDSHMAELESQNAKLRECVLWLWSFAKTCGVDADDLREYGVEVD